MIKETLQLEQDADRLFLALSNATSRDIVLQTLDREGSVPEVGRRYLIGLAAVQKHVGVLVVERMNASVSQIDALLAESAVNRANAA